MMASEFDMHGPNIQKASIPGKLAFANKGHLCSKSCGLGFISCFRPLLPQKLIGQLKDFE
jgi:hypothetical protein